MATPFNPRNVTVGYIEETVFGTTPATPTLQLIPFQSIGLKQSTETVNSRIIRSSRATTELLRNGISAEASINTEFLAAAYDDFMEASLLSTDWSDVTNATIGPVMTIDADFGTATFNDSGSGFDVGATGFKINQWIHVSGFSVAGSNGFYKITAAPTTSTLTVSPAPATDAAGDDVTIVQGASIEDGSTLRWFSFEEALTDPVTTDIYKKATGVSFDTFGMTIDVDTPITVQFGMLGNSMAADTTQMANAYTPASTNKVYTAAAHVEHLRSGSTHADTEILGFDFSVGNALSIRKLVGTLGAAKEHFYDEFTATGNLRIYVENAALLGNYINFTPGDLVGTVKDAAGNAYVFDFPNTTFSDMENDVEGGSDVILTLPWTAQDSASENVAMRVARFTSLP